MNGYLLPKPWVLAGAHGEDDAIIQLQIPVDKAAQCGSVLLHVHLGGRYGCVAGGGAILIACSIRGGGGHTVWDGLHPWRANADSLVTVRYVVVHVARSAIQFRHARCGPVHT